MKSFKILLFSFIAVFYLWACSSSANNEDSDPQPDTDSTTQDKKAFFHIQDGKLYDANQKEFIPRGINVAFYHWRNESIKALPYIANTGANSLRILWTTEGTIDDLDKYLQATVDQKMVPMVHLWDVTHDQNNPSELNRMAQYWADHIDVIQKYKKHILLNIANEWTVWGVDNELWRDAYKDAIKIIREAGYDGVLVIDAAANAQNPVCVKDYGQELLNYDAQLLGEEQGNLLFSIHMYVEWAKNPMYDNEANYYIADELAEIKSKKIPLVIGEFGYKNREHANCSLIDIGASEVMAECEKNGFGYYAWSWAGNGYEECRGTRYSIDILDMVKNREWESNNYSEWGKIVVDDPNGISTTSSPASIFE